MIERIKNFFVYLWTMLRLRYYYELGCVGRFKTNLSSTSKLLSLNIVDFNLGSVMGGYGSLFGLVRHRVNLEEEIIDVKEPTWKNKLFALLRVILPRKLKPAFVSLDHSTCDH